MTTIISQCIKKCRYATFAKAERYRAKCEAARPVKLRTYYCGICQGYHLTRVAEHVAVRETI